MMMTRTTWTPSPRRWPRAEARWRHGDTRRRGDSHQRATRTSSRAQVRVVDLPYPPRQSRRRFGLWLLASIVVGSLGCTPPPHPSYQRLEQAKADARRAPRLGTDDLQRLTQAVASRCLELSALKKLHGALGRAPRLRLTVRNATAERVETAVLRTMLEARLMAGGRLELLSGPTSGAERAKKPLGADLVGLLLVTKEQLRGEAGPAAPQAARYEATLSMTRVSDGRPLCRARHVIRKEPGRRR